MEKAFDVKMGAMAYMKGRVTVQIETDGKSEKEIEEEAEVVAVEKAQSGDIVWEYDGIADSEEIFVNDVSES